MKDLFTRRLKVLRITSCSEMYANKKTDPERASLQPPFPFSSGHCYALTRHSKLRVSR
uniref:Uncharacterized protein n=1 Tax=Rhinopithecus roxellana TaxID=61622 RepID=A0A2K6RC15_RHIRO